MRIAIVLVAGLLAGSAASADEEWEKFPDGSSGRVADFQGAGGVTIPAYIRKPDGPGPFPVLVVLHGGGYGKEATYGAGRSSRTPIAEFVNEGWAVYAIDYRPTKTMLEPIEIDDSIEAIKAVRAMPFVDPARLGLYGTSHGGNVASRLVSRVDTKGAILCAPAALDLIEIKKAPGRGETIVPVLNKLVAEMESKLGAKAEVIEKNPAKYRYQSALTEASGVRCPILIINGRNDTSSPISVVDTYAARVRASGKPVDMYLPDNGPHGFYWGRPEIPETKEAARRAVAFFRQCFGS